MTTTLQDQYTTLARRGQETTLAVVDAWTRSFNDALVRVPSVAGQAATTEAIDQAFDLIVKVLDVQRNAAKQYAASVASIAEDVVSQATKTATQAGVQESAPQH